MKPSLVFTGRERGREGGREKGREKGREGGRKGTWQGGMEEEGEKGTIMLVNNWLPFISTLLILHTCKGEKIIIRKE